MSTNGKFGAAGTIASLHLHPSVAGEPLTSVKEIELVTDEGIIGNPRYFGRTSDSGRPSNRQVSLIEQEVIAEHAATLGMQRIAPGAVRSNIETNGIDLLGLLGKNVRIGEAVLHFGSARTPCHKMDAICQGLRKQMENSRQGVMARVVKGGKVRIGDSIGQVA